jgi:predicted O-methyltransferase YrrM
VDTAAFLDALTGVFDEQGIRAGRVVDSRIGPLAAEVPGFTTPSELAVLSTAARVLPADEVYLEVGTFKGRSICAAMLDAEGKDLVAVENFQEFGMVGQEARAELMRHVGARRAGRSLRLVDGDCFEVLRRPGLLERPVGAYFYDGAHTGLAHWLALAVVEPLLADEALVLVDDASWPMVRRATERYTSSRPGWETVLDLPATRQDDPVWANGLLVLRFRRTGPVAPLSPTARALRRFQVHVRGPVTSLVWHTLHRFPWLVPLAKLVVPKRSRSVPGSPEDTSAQPGTGTVEDPSGAG